MLFAFFSLSRWCVFCHYPFACCPRCCFCFCRRSVDIYNTWPHHTHIYTNSHSLTSAPNISFTITFARSLLFGTPVFLARSLAEITIDALVRRNKWMWFSSFVLSPSSLYRFFCLGRCLYRLFITDAAADALLLLLLVIIIFLWCFTGWKILCDKTSICEHVCGSEFMFGWHERKMLCDVLAIANHCSQSMLKQTSTIFHDTSFFVCKSIVYDVSRDRYGTKMDRTNLIVNNKSIQNEWNLRKMLIARSKKYQ